MPTPKRFDGYIRVGRKGPGYISPTVQREAIARWAEYRGVEIAAWHVDEDESGGTQDWPGLREAIRRIESGETEGIACWRLNRFARNAGASSSRPRGRGFVLQPSPHSTATSGVLSASAVALSSWGM
jgi:Resolvase, N terminal domain.